MYNDEVITRQFAVEDRLVGRLIEDNHLVDAMFDVMAGKIGEENPLVPVVQSLRDRSRADHDLILTLRHLIDALHSQMASMQIQLAQKESELDEIDRERRNAELVAGLRDSNMNRVRIVSTGWQESASATEIVDYQLIDEPGKGYLAVMHDGMPNCWSWYGPGERYPSLSQMLASLAAGGHIEPLETAEAT